MLTLIPVSLISLYFFNQQWADPLDSELLEWNIGAAQLQIEILQT